MADLQRAEKLASAKKKLKQFQQKHRESQSESGRSTPSKKKTERDGFEKSFHSENGGSPYSLSHSENLSSNISGTDSPVPTLANSLDNLCHTFNGNSQPDILNTTSGFTLPKVSESLFKTPSPHSLFAESSLPVNSQSGSDFFDNLTTSNDPPDPPSDPTKESSSLSVSQAAPSLLNTGMFLPPQARNIPDASTPDGPHFQDSPNYSFPDVSFSPIRDSRNNKSHEAVSHELELQLKNSCARNEELENELSVQKNQMLQLQNLLEDMKKRSEEGAATLRHHVQAIQILVSEKTELQNTLEKLQEELNAKTAEVGELQGRLRASRHRVADLERELASTKTQLQTQETSIKELESQQSASMDESESQKKRIGDLELEISDLQSKLENRDENLKTLKADLEEKISKLSLSEIRIQQLSGGPDSDGAVKDLQYKNEELLNKVLNLERQLSATSAVNDESVKEYQRYVNRLHTELQELKTEHMQCQERCRQLEDREHQLVQQVNGLERQLSRVPQPTQTPEILPELHNLREQLRTAEETNSNLCTQLQKKDGEVECLREGLQERAFRIQELEMTVTRLENEWLDTANLQAAIESDKVAASRAIAQNNSLKKQLEELQDALVKLNVNRDELTRQLEQELQTNRDLAARLETMEANILDSKKHEEAEKAQQTEKPLLQECEVQTLNSQLVVSPEVMTKLEEKVRKTMGEIADLKDEKQRLEHLVLQLQGETETIGEYITLYQIQRGMLRQRAQEKDEQVAQLARDKEALRNKLTHLNCLVQRLVGQQTPNSTDVVESEVIEEHKDAITSSALPPDSANKETADQIRSLLTEIGSNNLVTSNLENSNINFHPCPWCSGRLITV